MTSRSNRWATTASIVALLGSMALAGYGTLTSSITSQTHTVAAGQLGSETTIMTGDALAPARSANDGSSSDSPPDGSVPGRPGVGLQPPPVPAPPVPGDAAPATAASGTELIQFVYFVEADEEVDPTAVDSISQQATLLQQFWFDQFGGTFVLADTVTVIRGAHPAAWYDTSPAGDDPRWYRLTNIRDEIQADLGLDPENTNVRIVAYPNARIDGRVGANRYLGAVMDGDDIACVDGLIDTIPYSADYPANCLATVAHELGHVFGLTHAGPDEDCMQFGFYRYVSETTTCQFSAENRSLVINDPYNQGWLDARPGDRRPGIGLP